jgi:hypothetical protein
VAVRLLSVWVDVDAEAVLAPVQTLLEAVFDAVHEVVLLLDQLSVLEPLEVTVVGLAERDTDEAEEDVLGEMPPLQATSPTKLATTQYVPLLKPPITHPGCWYPLNTLLQAPVWVFSNPTYALSR